jgi:hypothetical protein
LSNNYRYGLDRGEIAAELFAIKTLEEANNFNPRQAAADRQYAALVKQLLQVRIVQAQQDKEQWEEEQALLQSAQNKQHRIRSFFQAIEKRLIMKK